MRLFKQLPILAALLFASCHTMQGSGPSISAMRSDVGSVEFSDYGPDGPTACTPTAALPLRLGIVPPVSSSHDWRDNTTRLVFGSWSEDEIQILDSWCQEARASGIVAHFEFLPSLIVDSAASNVLDAVRSAARTRNLDAVLVAGVGTTVESSSTMLSILDLAIVPAFVLPTADFKATALFEGAILDAQTGYPYAVGSSESSYSKAAPSLIADRTEYKRKARLLALDTMSRRLVASVDPEVRAVVRKNAERMEAHKQNKDAGQQYWIGDPTPKGTDD